MRTSKIDIAVIVALSLLIISSIPLIAGQNNNLKPSELRELVRTDQVPEAWTGDIYVVMEYWWDIYDSPKDLYNEADLVVSGIVTGAYVEKDYNTIDGDVYTISTFLVDNTFKGKSETSIKVVQEGGVWNDITYKASDDPIMDKEEMAILFLRYVENEDRYVILGGPQGRFLIIEDKVYSLGEIVPEASSYTSRYNIKGISISDFVKSMQ